MQKKPQGYAQSGISARAEIITKAIAALLALSTLAYAQGNTWNRVRYNGGTVHTSVSYKDWDNTLSVTSDLITFKLKDVSQ